MHRSKTRQQRDQANVLFFFFCPAGGRVCVRACVCYSCRLHVFPLHVLPLHVLPLLVLLFFLCFSLVLFPLSLLPCPLFLCFYCFPPYTVLPPFPFCLFFFLSSVPLFCILYFFATSLYSNLLSIFCPLFWFCCSLSFLHRAAREVWHVPKRDSPASASSRSFIPTNRCGMTTVNKLLQAPQHLVRHLESSSLPFALTAVRRRVAGPQPSTSSTKRQKSLYDHLSALPNNGIGTRVRQTRWVQRGVDTLPSNSIPDASQTNKQDGHLCYWEVTRARIRSAHSDGKPHGQAWGRMYWRGT